MAKNEFWAIKYRNGWIDNRTHFTRRDAIGAYIDLFANGIYAQKTWRWHKRNRGVSVVKVRIEEIDSK